MASGTSRELAVQFVAHDDASLSFVFFAPLANSAASRASFSCCRSVFLWCLLLLKLKDLVSDHVMLLLYLNVVVFFMLSLC